MIQLVVRWLELGDGGTRLNVTAKSGEGIWTLLLARIRSMVSMAKLEVLLGILEYLRRLESYLSNQQLGLALADT